MEVTGRYKKIGNYLIHYDICGEGKPVICLPTAGGNSTEYYEVLQDIANAGYMGIALDLPGHGISSPDFRDLSIPATRDEFADFVWQFTKEMGFEKAAFVGCAATASMLLYMALEKSTEIGAIVAAEGNIKFVTLGECRFHNIGCVSMADYKSVSTTSLCGPEIPQENMNACIWHNSRNAAPEVMEADLGMYSGLDISEETHRISCPVLHIVGEYDCTVTDYSKENIPKVLPDAEQVILPGAGHFSVLEKPKEFAQEVIKFLNKRY